MDDPPESEDFIPPTENANRVARREPCACGDTIELPWNANEAAIERAVTRHQRTLRHVAWRARLERTGRM